MVYQYDYVEQAIIVMAHKKDVLQHAFAWSFVKMADVLELAEADDGEGLLVLVDWIDTDEDERT